VDRDESGQFFFGMKIPGNKPVKVNGRRIVKIKKTKTEEAAEKQVQEYKEDVKSGKREPGNVPAVNKKRETRKKCPVCNWRKGVNSKGEIVKHQAKGVTCPGSGKKPVVAKKGKK
jgi:hypothetical protein